MLKTAQFYRIWRLSLARPARFLFLLGSHFVRMKVRGVEDEFIVFVLGHILVVRIRKD
jgi:hypothetical protein